MGINRSSRLILSCREVKNVELRECYERMGADYEEVLKRLLVPGHIRRVLCMFPEDANYAALENAFTKKDSEAAERAVHSLKGICMNLGLSRLLASTCALADALKAGMPFEAAESLLLSVRSDYQTAVRAIRSLSE